MTTNSNLTDNLNMLPPGNFKVTIDSREFANVQFFCTTANLPTVSSSEVSSGYTHKNAYFPGDTIEYGTFDITFIVDEEMKNYIEKNREMGRLGYVDDGSRAAKKNIKIAQAKGIPDEILKKVSSRIHPSLSKYKFSRLKPDQFPKTVYHGSRTDQLSIDKISPMKRPRGKDAFDEQWDDAAGFYTHSYETLSHRYATGKKGTMYHFEVNPSAKVYSYTPPKGEKYHDGWHFVRLNNKDIQALREKGVEALYDKVADEFIIIGNPKKVFRKMKSVPVSN